MYYKSNSITGSNNTVPKGLSKDVCTTRATQLQVVITQFKMVCQELYVLQEQLNYR